MYGRVGEDRMYMLLLLYCVFNCMNVYFMYVKIFACIRCVSSVNKYTYIKSFYVVRISGIMSVFIEQKITLHRYLICMFEYIRLINIYMHTNIEMVALYFISACPVFGIRYTRLTLSK